MDGVAAVTVAASTTQSVEHLPGFPEADGLLEVTESIAAALVDSREFTQSTGIDAMKKPLADTLAVVTGAASGIGAATMQELAAQGARVAGIDRRAFSVPDGGFALTADISSEAEVLSAFAALDAAGEVPDIVVNCAGIIIERPLTRMTLEDFEQIMRVNLRGCFLVGREAVIRMRGAGRGGRMINIASELAHLGRADHSAYCASKAAVIGLTSPDQARQLLRRRDGSSGTRDARGKLRIRSRQFVRLSHSPH